MYSKFSDKNESRTVKIPEHYSGCAFSVPPKSTAPPTIKSPPAFLDVGKPSPATPQPPPILPSPPQTVSKEEPDPPFPIQKEEAAEAALSKASTAPPLLGNIGKAFPFSHGIGFEELLILGLILLLLHSDSDRDAVLWLGVLLFCG